MEATIRAAVLVYKSILVAKRQNRGYGLLILECHSDLQRVAKAVDQVVEPAFGLWWNPVPAPRNEKQIPECVKERLGTASLANQTLPLRTLDLPLRGTLMAIVEERSEIRPQIDLMKTIALRRTENGART